MYANVHNTPHPIRTYTLTLLCIYTYLVINDGLPWILLYCAYQKFFRNYFGYQGFRKLTRFASSREEFIVYLYCKTNKNIKIKICCFAQDNCCPFFHCLVLYCFLCSKPITYNLIPLIIALIYSSISLQ